MPWQDRYEQGSFRGIGFRTVSLRTVVGPREHLYEPPFSRKGASRADLGRRARRYEITARLLGRDYDLARDQLIDAIEQGGSGVLVHPSFGRVKVFVDESIEIRESTANGGSADITFRFVEANDQETPAVGADPRSRVNRLADQAVVATKADFQRSFSVDGPGNLLTHATGVIDGVLSDLSNINARVGAVLSTPSRVAGTIDRLSFQLASIIGAPKDLVDGVHNAIASIGESINRVAKETNDLVGLVTGDTDPEDADASARIKRVDKGVGSLRSTLDSANTVGDGTKDVTGDTPERAAQRRNRAAVLHATRSLLATELTRAATRQTFDNAGQARTVNDHIAQLIDNLLEGQVDGLEMGEQTFAALQDLQAASREHLLARIENLVEATSFEPAETLPSVVLAYLLYGDAKRHSEIEARNPHIRHGAFVPGGVPIEVLRE